MSETDILKVETYGKVRLLSLNRPAMRNALNRQLSAQLSDALLKADFDDSVSMVAIAGTGEKAFCSGADLGEARDLAASGQQYRGPLRAVSRTLCEILIDCRKPSLAIVNGPAVAGGFELALACDLRIAADHAFFALPEAKRGRGAYFGSVVLPQIVPPAIAVEWLFTGRRIEVDEAQKWGLLNRVVPSANLFDEAMAFCSEIVSSAPLSLERLKLTYRKSFGMGFSEGIRLDVGPDVYSSGDQIEGARAYLEKRDPVWQGK